MTSQSVILQAALDAHPQLAKLIFRVRDWDTRLLDAWNLGAQTSEVHPLIDLLLGDNESHRRRALDDGLAALASSEDIATEFAQRILGRTIPEHRDAAASLTELYVGGSLTIAGAKVSFVKKQKGKRTPDLTATRGNVTVTIEVSSVNVSDPDRDKDVADAKLFREWARGGARPKLERADASEYHGGGVRVFAKTVLPLGGGDLGKMVGRVASAKGDDQLKGWPNPVLVRSFWHTFGVGRRWCTPDLGTDRAPITGLLYAATYGREHDPIYEGETFDGEPLAHSHQAGDGILVASSIVRAVLWLFENHEHVMFESEHVSLDDEARELLLDAFGLHGDALSRFRRRPSRDEIAIAAFYRWLARGGSLAPEAEVDDWLAAESGLVGTPR